MQAFLKPVRHLPNYLNLANFAFWSKVHKVVRKILTFFFLKKIKRDLAKVVEEQSCVVAWWYICNIFQTHWEPLIFVRSKNMLNFFSRHFFISKSTLKDQPEVSRCEPKDWSSVFADWNSSIVC